MKAPLIVGNWKMHGTRMECRQLTGAILRRLKGERQRAEVVLAPPYCSLDVVQRSLGRNPAIKSAAQDCHWEESGAFTGEISPGMIKDAGCTYVIVGHSERRHIIGETDAVVARKFRAALTAGLRPILCVGETLAERQSGKTATVILRQLRSALKGLDKSAIELVEIAYEPVWAIGTGLNATSKQVASVHGRIRNFLKKSFGNQAGGAVRILYGGSVKPENAGELLQTPEVNGLLVGGASLNAETFVPIVECVKESR